MKTPPPGKRYSLGISPCPNDTFIFEALIHRRISLPFSVAMHMVDVEALNELVGKVALDITKLSLTAILNVLDKYMILNAGAALGRGCGPLVVSRPGLSQEALATARVAIPGRLTTANLLLSLTDKFHGPRQEMVFDQVMPALLSGRADIGVIIHEGRFTYANKGLSLILDLGAWWEEHTGLPLPLGVIAIRRDLGVHAALEVQDAIKRSVEYASAFPEQSKAFIRTHAQEMDEKIIDRHIATFVNDFSRTLGSEGQGAILSLLKAAQAELDPRHTNKTIPPLTPEAVFAPVV